MPVPEGSTGRAGGLPEVFTTAHDAIFTQANCAPASTCSCTAAPAASARPRSSSGARPGRARHRDRAQRGAARAGRRARRQRDRARGLRRARGPFDVILELVGAPNMPENLQALATGGRIAVIGVSAGAKTELNLLALMGKRARIHGSTLRARPLEEKALAARLVEREVLPLFRPASSRCRSPRPSRSTRPPPPTSASPRAASWASSARSSRSGSLGGPQ